MSIENIEVRKESGELVQYEEGKLTNSLMRAGAPKPLAEDITNLIRNILYNGITTREIYKKAFSLLRKNSRSTAGRYKLKKAIMELGESGYPFEKFVAELMEADGYKTQVGIFVDGKCIKHEVDVLAENPESILICECKFHNTQARYSDVKVPLYINSRYNDIIAKWKEKTAYRNKSYKGFIITNTRFTTDALAYGNCVGLHMVSWQYPHGKGIKDQIDLKGVHPITCMTSLNMRTKKALIEKGIVTCKSLVEQPSSLDKLLKTVKQKETALEEAQAICFPENLMY